VDEALRLRGPSKLVTRARSCHDARNFGEWAREEYYWHPKLICRGLSGILKYRPKTEFNDILKNALFHRTVTSVRGKTPQKLGLVVHNASKRELPLLSIPMCAQQ